MPAPVAFLDANVLYPARLRDLFLRLAIAGLYQACWSEQVLNECFNSVAADRPDVPNEHFQRTRKLMGLALPDAAVTGFEHLIGEITLPDPDDRHVLAAAIVAGASHLVTANLRDFPAPALPTTITVTSPDTFVAMLIHQDLDTVLAVIETQAAALKNPPMTSLKLLDGLHAVGLQDSIETLRKAIL